MKLTELEVTLLLLQVSCQKESVRNASYTVSHIPSMSYNLLSVSAATE